MRLIRVVVVIAALLLLSPGRAFAPEHTDPPPPLKVIEVSRGAPEPTIERRLMRITAYTNHDQGMDGKGITANGERTQEGRTIAAPSDVPFGTQIYIPALGTTYTVTDRGGAIVGDRLDVYMQSRDEALQFGVQDLEVWIREEL